MDVSQIDETTTVMGFLEFVIISMTVVSFAGYAMLLAVILTNSHLLTYTNRLIIALSISDVLNLLSTTLSGLVGPAVSYSEYNCILIVTPALAFPLVSINLFSLIAVERFVSVFYPLRYHSIMTWKRLMLSIAGAYVCGFSIGLLPILGWNNRNIHQEINFRWNSNDCPQFLLLRGDYMALIHIVTLVEAVFITVVYVKILVLARKLSRNIAAQRQSIYASRGSSINDVSDNKDGKDFEVVSVKQGTTRGVKVLLFLVIVYVTTKFPLKVCNAVQYEFWTQSTIFSLNVPREIFVTCVVLSQTNSVLYPFIYAFANKDIYEVLRRKLTRTKTVELSTDTGDPELPGVTV